MKPSTVKKIKVFKVKVTKAYYNVMYPLAWVIRKIEKFKYNRIKSKATIETTAKLFAKEMYKAMCKYDDEAEREVYVAEHIDVDYYDSVESTFKYYTTYNSKARKYGRALGIHNIEKELCEEFINQVVVEFDKLNEYTYAKKIVEDTSKRWGLRGYKFTCVFGVKEDVK